MYITHNVIVNTLLKENTQFCVKQSMKAVIISNLTTFYL